MKEGEGEGNKKDTNKLVSQKNPKRILKKILKASGKNINLSAMRIIPSAARKMQKPNIAVWQKKESSNLTS